MTHSAALAASASLVPVVPRLPPPLPSPVPRGAVNLLGIGVSVALGAAAGFAGLRFGRQMADLKVLGGTEMVVFLLWLPLTWLIAVAWHECGHLLAGRSVGGRFLLLVVGPFKWVRTPAGVRFGLNRSLNAAGGLAASMPTDDRDLPRRLAVMVAGGPTASLGLALAMAGLAAWIGRAAWPLGHGMALTLGGMSALLFVVTVFPARMGGFKSDGLRFYSLLRGGPGAAQEAALLSLTVATLGGVRPADLDPEKLAAATAPDDGSLFVVYGHLCAFQHFADRRDFAAAQARLDRVIAGEAELPGFMREMARAEYAWLLGAAAVGGAGEAAAAAGPARAWLESAGKVAYDVATRHRAEAAVLLVEGRRAEAAASARAGLLAIETRSMTPVRNAFAADALAELLRRAEG